MDVLTFGEIRPLISRLERISILNDDMSYQNYASIRDVPVGAVDARPVKGIGYVEFVEFSKSEDARYPIGAKGESGDIFFADAMEFWLGDPGERSTVSGGLDALYCDLSSLCRQAWALSGEVGGDAGEKLEWCAGDLGNVLGMIEDVAKLLGEGSDAEPCSCGTGDCL